MDKEYKVYSITNNINNKKYIGLTSQGTNERIKKGKGYKPMTKFISQYRNMDGIILKLKYYLQQKIKKMLKKKKNIL